MSDHCLACQIARELTEHRDATATDWSYRRGTLTFAITIARRTCPAHIPAIEEKS